MNRSGLLSIHFITIEALWAMTLALIPSANSLFAQGQVFWQQGGVELCPGSWDGPAFAIASDSACGAIVAWADYGDGQPGVYAQRVDRHGESQWSPRGVLLRGYVAGGSPIRAVSDGNGGAIAVWREVGTGPYILQLAAQRVDANGDLPWGPDGVVVVGSNADRGFSPVVMGDGDSGCFVAWQMANPDSSGQDSVCVARLDSIGRTRWVAVVIVDSLMDNEPSICPDGAGGIVVAWTRWCHDRGAVLVQRVDGQGRIHWDSTGVRPSSTGNHHFAGPAILSTGGQPVVAWIAVDDGQYEIWAQSFDLDGRTLWGIDGKPVRTDAIGPFWAANVIPGRNGATNWLWEETNEGRYELHAQTLDSSGSRLWDTSGVFVGATRIGAWRRAEAQPDQRGGMLAVWQVFRHEMTDSGDLYAQRIDASGRRCWSDTGLAVCRDTFLQRWEPVLTVDGLGGGILAWGDYRRGPPSRTSVYAQRIGDVTGVSDPLGPAPTPGFVAWPNPVRGRVRVIGHAGSEHITTEVLGASGQHVAWVPQGYGGLLPATTWTGEDDGGRPVPTGTYFWVIRSGPRHQVAKFVWLARK